MKYFTLLVTIFIFSIGSTFAQSRTVKKANNLYELNKFSEAIPLYQKALKKDDNKIIKTKLANCYRRTNQMDKAEQLYLEVIESGRFNDKVLLYYSEALMTNEKYNDAKDYLKRYITRKPNDEKAHLLLASCEAVNNIQPYFPKFRKKRFTQNSDNDDSSPVYYRNGIAFTSDRNQGAKFLKQKSGWTGRDYAMIYYSAQNIDGTFEIPVSLSPKFNDLNINSGPISFTSDGKYAVFSRNSKIANNSDEYPMQLYSATADEDNKWRDVQLISFCKNTHNYMHPAISPDGRFLYYVSDRRSGQGGTDIYVAERKTNGEWKKPVNLGPIVNSALNEGFPFAHADGRLFFSSKGHPGFGGFDLFVTQRDSKGEWTTPLNLGRPVNSSVDDVSFFLFEDGSGGFYSSAVDKGHDEIYLFSLLEEEEIFVRFEDDPEKKVFADTSIPAEKESNQTPTHLTTPDSGESTIDVVYQPETEVATNEPFNDGQALDNDTQKLLKSSEQTEIGKTQIIEDHLQQSEINKDIIADTQVSLNSPPDPKEDNETIATNEKPQVTNIHEVERKEDNTTADAKQVIIKSMPTEEKETEIEKSQKTIASKTLTEEVNLPQPKQRESIAAETKAAKVDEDTPQEPRREEMVETTPEQSNEIPVTEKEAVKEDVVSSGEKTYEPETYEPSTPTSPNNDLSNSTEANTKTPDSTSPTQNFEVYPGKEPSLEPEVVEEVRPFNEPNSPIKTTDAFGAIEQELVNKTLTKGRTFVLPNVKYPFNEFVFQVSESIRYELDRLIYLLKDYPDLKIEIGCYSESFGEDGVNKALSRYRAQAAADYLINQGIARERISAKGYGESKPLNHCVNGVLCTRSDHLVNQRMEVKVVGF